MEDKLTGEMARIVSNRYLHNLHRVQAEFDMENVTLDAARRSQMRAEVPAEVCLEMMDALIMQRFDYLVKREVNHVLENNGHV